MYVNKCAIEKLSKSHETSGELMISLKLKNINLPMRYSFSSLSDTPRTIVNVNERRKKLKENKQVNNSTEGNNVGLRMLPHAADSNDKYI